MSKLDDNVHRFRCQKSGTHIGFRIESLSLGTLLHGSLLELLHLLFLSDATKRVGNLFLRFRLTLEEPVAKEDFGSDSCWRRLVDNRSAIRSEKDGLQDSGDASLT